MKNNFFYKLKVREVLDAFWMRIDIIEMDADAYCEFSDDFSFLEIAKTNLSLQDILCLLENYNNLQLN